MSREAGDSARRRARTGVSADLFREPLAAGAACENDADLALCAARDDVAAIVLDAGAIVDQDEGDALPASAGPLSGERVAGRSLEDRAVPAAIARAGVLEGAVGGRDALVELGALGASAAHDIAPDEEEEQDGRDHDDHDCDGGHAASVGNAGGARRSD